MTYSPIGIAVAMVTLVVVAPSLALGQQVGEGFRNPRRAERLATTHAAVDSLERTSRAFRKVLVDSALGTPLWVEFSSDQQAAEQRGGTVDGVLAAFLARHRQMLGIETVADLREVSRVANKDMVHVRYRQYWRGIRIWGGELRVHLRLTPAGYVVESANSRLYADVDAPVDAAVTPGMALATASSRLIREGVLHADSSGDGPLAIRPLRSGYRLVYTIVGARHGAIVDAVSGEVLEVVSRAQSASPPVMRRRRAEPGIQRPPMPWGTAAGAVTSLAGYVSGSGTDALGQFHQSGSFLVYFNDTEYELRSAQLYPYVSEVIVREYGEQIMEPCATPTGYPPSYPFPIATNPTTQWPSGDGPRQHQVSGMINGLGSGKFYRDSLGRRSYDDALPGSALTLCVDGVADPEYPAAALSFPSDNSLGFDRAVPGTARKGAVAAQDIVTHEFTHNVARDEDVAQNWDFEPYGSPEHETGAMNEGLADYFGARHRGSACHGLDAFGGCSRNLDNMVPYATGRTQSIHNFGVVFSGALWQVAALSPPLGKDVDNATYDAIRFYMLESAQMLHSREAVVRAAQDRKHANQNLADIVPSLEDAFADRGIGYPPVFVWQSTVPNCGMGVQVTVGDTNRRYQITFESGSGLNQDHSVTNVSYSAQLAPFGWHDGDQTFQYTPEQLGGHQLGDGHAHDLRVRFNDGMLGVAGILLDYYVGWAADEECYAFPNEGSRQRIITEGSVALGGIPPAELTVRQVVSDGAGVRVEMSGGARPDGARPGLAAQVARSGLMTLEYGVPAAARGRTTIRVYDLRGRLVRTMTDVPAGPGWARVTWDGRDDSGSAVAAGVYLAVVRAGEEAVRSRFIVPAR